MGDLCGWSVERQESSPRDELGEKTKAKGLEFRLYNIIYKLYYIILGLINYLCH